MVLWKNVKNSFNNKSGIKKSQKDFKKKTQCKKEVAKQ